jgi:hypothetical protein
MEQFIRGHHAPGSVTAEILANQGITVDQSLAALRNAVQTGTLPDFLKRSQLGAAKFIEANAPQFTQVNAGGYGYTQQIPGLGGPATEVKGSRFNVTRSPNSQVTNFNMGPLEGEEQKLRAKYNMDRFAEVNAAATQSKRTAVAIDTALGVLDKGFKTGTGTETMAKLASVASALGIPETTDFANDAAVFRAAVQRTVLDRQLEQKGTQTANDATRIEQTAASFANPTDANRFLLSAAKAQVNYDLAQKRFMSKWWASEGTLEGAEDAWYEGEGSKSLFSDPALAKYAPKEEQAAAAPAGKTVKRTGTLGGRKVVEYSDGSVAYAD